MHRLTTGRKQENSMSYSKYDELSTAPINNNSLIKHQKKGIGSGVTLDLPYPPSVNNYWHVKLRRGRPTFMVSQAGRNFRLEVIACVTGFRSSPWYFANLFPLTPPVSLHLDIYPPDHRKRDIDNILKSLLDSLETAGIVADDSQIATLNCRRLAVEPRGRVRMTAYGQ